VGFHPSHIRTWLTEGGRDWSYGTYLYAFPVQQFVLWISNKTLGPYELFVLAFAATLPCAALSWRFVEQPALMRKIG
jgi:peptidoglycan/LPS O-acetylase OafA/YrhL